MQQQRAGASSAGLCRLCAAARQGSRAQASALTKISTPNLPWGSPRPAWRCRGGGSGRKRVSPSMPWGMETWPCRPHPDHGELTLGPRGTEAPADSGLLLIKPRATHRA